MEGVLRLIGQRLDGGKKTFVVTPNPEFLVFGCQHQWFKKLLNSATIAIPDGIALLWALRVIKGRNFFVRLGIGFWTGLKVIFAGWGRKRVTGTDLMEKLCQLAAKKGWSVYLFGGELPGVAWETLRVLKERYPGLRGWANSGPKFEIRNLQLIGNWQLEIGKLVEEINVRQPTFLFVALGMGKQEKFIWDNWGGLDVKLAMGVGGAFNYLSGRVKRAPIWIQNLGFEWLYRLYREPRRAKRQRSLLTFIWLVLKGK
jgi:N-acetylglucosaminyldiphosphoundecaprenol N-acetyl-beta-D-mannosaminyltransferase